MGEEEMTEENTSEVLGTAFEMSLRILLIFDLLGNTAVSSDRISAIDFIAVYGADFGLLDENLHGYGFFRFSEFASRGELTKAALKELVLKRFVIAKPTKHGFIYAISTEGRAISQKLQGDYAKVYCIAVREALHAFKKQTDDELCDVIHRRILQSIQEG